MTQIDPQKKLITTARWAGIWYLLMAVSGVLGFLVFHPQIYHADPQQTLANLTEQESIARIRLLLEFAIVVSQALTAVWFYRLFRNIDNWAAMATGIWGTVNAIVIMISAIAMASAIKIAQSSMASDKVLSIELLNGIISHAWGVGSLFFGLWLIPLGYIVASSKRMPVWLGRILMVGGLGYMLSAVINYSGLEFFLLEYLTFPATFGEFWMIGYLLIFGIRPGTSAGD